MAKYQVPQYIEVEDKIFGPLTLKQFLYSAGGVGLAFLAWRFLPPIINYAVAAILLGFFLSLAFFQFNGKPFVYVLESVIKYIFSPRLYVWKKEEKVAPKPKEEEKVVTNVVSSPKISESKLKELAWGLDINDKVNVAKDQDDLSDDNNSLNIKV